MSGYRCASVNQLFSRLTRSTVKRLVSTTASLSDGGRLDFDIEVDLPFSRAKLGPFFQSMPQLGNQFNEDVTLRNYLKRHLSDTAYNEIAQDLERFGGRVSGDLLKLHKECEKNPPVLEQFNGWGQRVDNIITCDAWNKMKAISAEEGLIAIAYEGKYSEHSRLYQLAKIYLFASSSGLYSCPLAMTDGACKSLKSLSDAAPLKHAYAFMTTRNPEEFWTSGQWMTERKGGSDVACGTETVAIPQSDGSYKLYGYKWFTSATDSDIALTLARIIDHNGKSIEGTKGLSMFYLETRDQDGNLNHIEVQRLKDKLGTRQLPTAELLLDGTRAHRISPEGRGVASIATMLTMTRIHNSLSAAANMRRIVNLARDYSTRRRCFGKIIKDHPLHIKSLSNMEIETRAALLFCLELSRLLGLDDCDKMTSQQRYVFRLMTPVLKLYTAKQAVAVVSEGLECFGGAGYLEDTGLPQILRDAQVLPIWEGTTNILSLDTLRAISKSQGQCLRAYHEDVTQRVSAVDNDDDLRQCADIVRQAASDIVSFAEHNMETLEVAAREFAYSLARIYIGMLLIEHANWSGATPLDALVAKRWCQQDLTPVISQFKFGNFQDSVKSLEYDLVFDGYDHGLTRTSKL